MILTRDKNRSKVKLQKIDLGKNQSIVVDANNKTKMNDVTVTSLQSTASDIGSGACTSLTCSGNISTTNGAVNINGISISSYDSTSLQINRLRCNTLVYTDFIRQMSAGVVTIQDSVGTARLKLCAGSGAFGIAYLGGTSTDGSGNYIRFRYNDNSHLYVYSDGVVKYDLVAPSSDDRIKTNESLITPSQGLGIIKKLRPEIYDKRSKIDQVPTPENTIRESGFITQQIWYDVPELRHCVNLAEDAEPVEGVVIDHDDPNQDLDYTTLGWGSTTASLNHNMFLPYLVASIQKLSAEVDLLKSRITQIEGQVP